MDSLHRSSFSFPPTSQRHSGRRHGTLLHVVLFGLSLATACQYVLAQAMYRINPTGIQNYCLPETLAASGLNEFGEVSGFACNAEGYVRAFLWKNNGSPVTDLGPRERGSQSFATSVNSLGVVTGYAHDSTGNFAFLGAGNGSPLKRIYGGQGASDIHPDAINDGGQIAGALFLESPNIFHAFVWKNDGTPIVDLGTFGGSTSSGYAINASGQVVGYADYPGDSAFHAFVWKNDGSPKMDLDTLGGGYSDAIAINAKGEIAGFSETGSGNAHAFIWRNNGTHMQDLGTLGGFTSVANAINDRGQATGYADTPGGWSHAFVWLNNGSPMKDLGALSGRNSFGYAINSSGQVTGESSIAGSDYPHAFLWRHDGTKLQDLNALIDPRDPLKPYVTLQQGNFINDSGEVVATGLDSRTGLRAVYLLKGTLLTLSPRSLAFGILPINKSSAAKSVTVTNTSDKVVAVTSIAIRGSAPGQFASTNNCDSSLAGHATCTIEVTFGPTTTGAKSASLKVNGGGSGLRTVTLTGTGT